MNNMPERFHVPQGVYLLSHSVGCLPKTSESQVAEDYLSVWKTSGGDAWPQWLDIIDGFCTELSLMLGGAAKDYCPQSNLSSGLTKYLMSMPLNKNKNKILMHASAFPSMGFVVQCLKGFGYELKLINEQDSPCDLAIWQQHLSDDVAAALITHVHSNTGLLSPVGDIAKLCRSAGILAMVDVAQSAGVMPISIPDWQVDVVFGSCVKWLCGGPGAGFMWLNPQHLVELSPMDVGWFSHENPFEFDIEHFAYANTAKRFWGGTPSVAPFAMAQGSIKLMNKIGLETIYRHNRHLLGIVLAAAQPYLITPISLPHWGGTLCLQLEPALTDKIALRLQQQGAYFDRRGNTLRLSLHIYNTEQEAQQVAQFF
jgi:kynureninase